jgi:epoxyqueuosine reductase
MSETDFNPQALQNLANEIKHWAKELGFQQCAISDIDLEKHEAYLRNWLKQNYHGEMHYMEAHGSKRSRPYELVPGTLRSINLRMDYLPNEKAQGLEKLEQLQKENKAYIARYALGRDYHKLIRKRLQKLAEKIEQQTKKFEYRVFVDSAPVLERALADKSGIGWTGKNTMILNREAGSWFFLAEIFINLPLPVDASTSAHCGTCTACMDLCPTNAFVSDKQLDARKCISYLTIEHKSSIPEDLRPLMGNRIFGCDDCQLVCPWNKYAQASEEKDFSPRHHLDDISLLELFQWTEEEFLSKTEGSPIRRIGYERWLRNIAVALGNALPSQAIKKALKEKMTHPSPLVKEHVEWALKQLEKTG